VPDESTACAIPPRPGVRPAAPA